MRRIAILLCSIACALLAHAQQYGWSVISQPSLSSSIALQFVDSLHGWMGQVLNDRIFRTSDGGYTWVGIVMPASVNTITGISMIDTAWGWAVGDAGVIFRTTDGGQTWITQYRNILKEFYSNASLTRSKSLAAGHRYFDPPDSALIYRTTNGGAQWQEQAFPPFTVIISMDFIDSLNGWASGGVGSFVLRTRDGGSTWTNISMQIGLNSLTFVDTLHGWGLARTSPSKIMRTTNGGVQWNSQLLLQGDFVFNRVKFADTLNGWAFGDTVIQGNIVGLIYRTTNGGSAWFAELRGSVPGFGAGTALDKYHAWAVCGSGQVLKYGLITSVSQENPKAPKEFHLGQNYPNPFNPSTRIEYSIPKRTRVRLTVSDVLGRTVKVLVNTEQEEGTHSVEFNAKGLASGEYFYTLKTHEFEATQSMVVLR